MSGRDLSLPGPTACIAPVLFLALRIAHIRAGWVAAHLTGVHPTFPIPGQSQ